MSKDNEKLKKKEMTNNTDKKKAESNVTSDTIYKQTVDHEEAEAVLRTGEDDMNVYMQLCSKLRSHILQLTDSTESPTTLDNIKREASLSFVMLKKLNRLEKYRLKNARETLASKKSKVDSFNLQLQNLRYEIHHLKKEVVKCLQFKSKDEDIDLVDEETFYKDAPEDISRPDITQDNPHQLKLARLQWELSQRKELSGLCGQVERENESVAANINKKRGQLDNLAPLLKQLLSVSKPLIENLSYPENPARSQYKLAHLLPEPLYCLFIQTDAYKQAFCPSIEVKINGKEEEAEQVNKMLTEASNPVESDSETEEATNNTQESSTTSKHRHHHHHSKSHTAAVVTVKPSDKPEDKRQKLCLAHPLSVDLVLKSKGSSGASLTCSFSYLYNLHLVTVKVSKAGIPGPGTAGSNHLEAELLAGLFPEDEKVGEEEGGRTPNLTNHYLLKQAGLIWDALKLGHPYLWVQRLAGLSFPLSSSSWPSVNVAAAQTSVPRVVKRLARRFKSVQELAALLTQLESGQLLEAHQCSLSSWQALSWAQYRASETTRYIVSGGIVTSSCPVYKAVLSRATAKCTAFVAINHDYPTVTPIFCVQIELPTRGVRHSANDDAVRDMEKELNVFWREHGPGESILRTQVECLASCFDIYLECLGLKDFPRKMSFVKTARGRTRAHPYKCSSKGEAMYTQR